MQTPIIMRTLTTCSISVCWAMDRPRSVPRALPIPFISCSNCSSSSSSIRTTTRTMDARYRPRRCSIIRTNTHTRTTTIISTIISCIHSTPMTLVSSR
uniref:Putative secreted protein n=1 Tax=Anopheles darlingi TaxID=43151 RepID=A0A2M4DL69_ANODA